MIDCILVLDFGGQYCHLIARKIRELGVYSEIVHPEITVNEIEEYKKRYDVKGIIISGGPRSVYRDDLKFDRNILNLGIPILGICYGHQLLAYISGGKVGPGKRREFGITRAYIDKPEKILRGLNKEEEVWMSHSDIVVELPQEYEILAHTKNTEIAAFMHKEGKIYGVQWHPEVIHTKNGKKIFENFIFEICNCKQNWRIKDFIEETVRELRNGIGGEKAIIALSGGVDSSTAAILTYKAIGKNLYAIFVDTGLMRKNEPELIRKIFTEKFDINFIFVDARDEFFRALRGIKDPEEKRRIIGEKFIRIFEREAKRIKAKFLVQGTIYPDRIESGIRIADKIKSHHNVGGLPHDLKLDLVEPLQDLYKDEVREVAKKLGLPDEIVYRHPFPGPGLAIRIVGEVTPESVEIVREANAIVEEEIKRANLYMDVWQCFAVLLPVRSVGVQGDVRTYKRTIAIRIVQSQDGMTANFARIPYDVLERISTRITNEISQVNRVVYDITHKPPATIEWE